MTITPQQFRAARAFLGWSQRDLAAKARVSRATITNFEIGISQPQVRVLDALVETLERAGIVFTSAVEGVYDPGVTFKWGMTPPLSAPGEGAGPSEDDENGVKAAWNFEGEETANLDALLGEAPTLNPGIADYWRTAPELWASLSEGGREILSRSMFGDCRAASEEYFRGGFEGTA
jgi:transcriptional regulator with XRE-family HTH domain